MAPKKTIASVVASTVIASTFFTVPADAASHKVKSGDTLSHIALDNDTTVDKLKKQNDLDSNLITTGQKLTLDKDSSSDSSSDSSDSSESSSSSDYKVNSGDTLSGIAIKNDTTVSKLKKQNDLDSNLITVGQKLTLNKNSSSDDSSSESSDSSSSSDDSSNDSSDSADEIVETAKSLEGTPYIWGGTSPSGFDSSGFINYVFEQNDVSLSRTHDGMWANDGEKVSNPEPGDVVFFEGTYKAGISHSGIYLGDDQMIHAGTEETGVEVVTPESWNYYWADHYAGAKRF